ncbi:uncharacterized protein LOC130277529 [Hyla sarda]|uniref:uncharacterized protein LOC130277529 n=1 Tax=Hyla sarda TaxID=327740 RepID=UPI0024C43A68|nr:uncharacterized protein LOC130277529 [Hyla sarda]
MYKGLLEGSGSSCTCCNIIHCQHILNRRYLRKHSGTKGMRMGKPREQQVPKKRRRKEHHRQCLQCAQPLPDEYELDVCSVCSYYAPSSSAFQDEAKQLFGWLRSSLQSALADVSGGQKSSKYAARKHPSPPSPSSSSQEGSADEDSFSSPSPAQVDVGAPDDYYLLNKDKVHTLLKAVKKTVEGDLEEDKLLKKEALFYFPQATYYSLPGQPFLDPLIKSEGRHPEKKTDFGSRFKATYRMDPGSSEAWDSLPKVDLAVARLSKKWTGESKGPLSAYMLLPLLHVKPRLHRYLSVELSAPGFLS